MNANSALKATIVDQGINMTVHQATIVHRVLHLNKPVQTAPIAISKT